MDQRERIETKKVIIKQSQDPTSEIPPLPYSHLEIVNFETHLDETLIGLLDEDNLAHIFHEISALAPSYSYLLTAFNKEVVSTNFLIKTEQQLRFSLI